MGQLLKAERIRREASIADLAQVLGVSRRQMQRFEEGDAELTLTETESLFALFGLRPLLATEPAPAAALPHKWRSQRIRPAQRQELTATFVSQYQAGMSIRKIAAANNRSYAFVWETLRAAGTKLHPHGTTNAAKAARARLTDEQGDNHVETQTQAAAELRHPPAAPGPTTSG